MSHRHNFSLWFLFLVIGLAAPALAEERLAAAKAEPKSEAKSEAKTVPTDHPNSRRQVSRAAESRIVTTAFGDWALRCRKESEKKEKAKDAPKEDRACEISETLEAQDHSGPLAKLSIGRPGGKGDLTAIIILPNNVSFPSSVHIRSDDKDIWGVRLDWIRCIPGGCFAQTTLADATVHYWHGLNTTGAIVFKDSSGENVSLPMSFRGFGEALDALNKTQ